MPQQRRNELMKCQLRLWLGEIAGGNGVGGGKEEARTVVKSVTQKFFNQNRIAVAI